MNEFHDVSREELNHVAGGSVPGLLIDGLKSALTGLQNAIDKWVELLTSSKHYTGGRFMLDVGGHNVGDLPQEKWTRS